MSELGKITCIGGVAVNRKYQANRTLITGTSNPGTGLTNFGGVARNVAENLKRLDVDVAVVSMIGDDENGRLIEENLRDLNIDAQLIKAAHPAKTAEYLAVFEPDGELNIAIAAMDIFDDLAPEKLDRIWSGINDGAWVFLECNLPSATLQHLLGLKAKSNIKIAIDTVSMPKAQRLPADLSAVDLLFTNRDEAGSILGDTAGDETELLARQLRQRGAKAVVITCGAAGVCIAEDQQIHHFESVATEIVDVSGAGDALISGTLFGILSGIPLSSAIQSGIVLAGLTVGSNQDVISGLSQNLLKANAEAL